MIYTRCACGHVEDIPPIRAHLTDVVTGWTFTWTCHECHAINDAPIATADVPGFRTAGVAELRVTTLVHQARTDRMSEFTEDEYLETARHIHEHRYPAALARVSLGAHLEREEAR